MNGLMSALFVEATRVEQRRREERRRTRPLAKRRLRPGSRARS